MRRYAVIICCFFFCASVGRAQKPGCDLRDYKSVQGLKAQAHENGLQVEWQGERGEQLRAGFGIRDAQPLVLELAVRKGKGDWSVLARNLSPEFNVVTGRRRIGTDSIAPLKQLNQFTPENIEHYKWNAFWDAPLQVPGASAAGSPGVDMPRLPSEIHRAKATYQMSRCQVKTNGSRMEITFPGLSMGIFSGELVYTVYKGSNLVRQEAVAKTDESSVAYIYSAGMKGFDSASANVAWQDVAQNWEAYNFGGPPNTEPVGIKARNRLEIVEAIGGSLGVLPSPHKFFFAREITRDLGYLYYRKDSNASFAVGIRMPEAESPESTQANFALYNAPPGTMQRMAVYFYLSPDKREATQQEVLAYTHGDVFKPLPGFQVEAGHFHEHFHKELMDAGSVDYMSDWIPALRGIGVKIVMLADFHPDPAGAAFFDNKNEQDAGPLRLTEQQAYFEGSRHFSDRDFLILPEEEPDVYMGGHYMMFFPKPVYWTLVREPGQPLKDHQAPYGEVYHTGSVEDVLQMLRETGGVVWQAHPETKGATGYPTFTRNTDYFKSDLFIGASFQSSLPTDLSQQRLCEARCLDLLDQMNNWAGPKYMMGENDQYRTAPQDSLYPYTPVNYLRLAQVPRFDDGWGPVVKALSTGAFFVTSGEVLFHDWGVEGSGPRRTYTVDAEWTFPLEFAELIWGDGNTVDRELIPATDFGPFGTHQFTIPFDVTGKKWVRFALWDSAGNGAFTQPIQVK
jgi:hypothetical protein